MHCVNQDWQADEEKFVGERQIEDVQVGHSFHFAETQNHAGNGKRIEMLAEIWLFFLCEGRFICT